MKKNSFLLITVIITFIILFAGCPNGTTDLDGNGGDTTENEDPVEEDGTVTVNLSGAADRNGDTFIGYAYAAGEKVLGDASKILAIQYTSISDGTASIVLKTADGSGSPTSTDWTATGGESYDIYIYFTGDSELGYDDNTRLSPSYPRAYTIDGDLSINLTHDDMVHNYVAIDIEGAEAQNGKDLYLGAWNVGDDPSTDDMLAGCICTIHEGEAYTVAVDPDTKETWEGVGGTTYDFYLFIDIDGDEWVSTGDYAYIYTGSIDPGDPLSYPFPSEGAISVTTDYDTEYEEVP